MRDFLNAGIIISLISLSACSTFSSRQDEMCAEIARFANASDDTAEHSIELASDYGSIVRFNPDKNIIYTQKCENYGYSPGITLCNYLVGNTSIEFSKINLNRALSCLGAPNYAVTPPSIGSEQLDVVLWFYSAPGINPDVNIGVQHKSGSDGAPPSLRVMAKRSRP